MYTYSDGARDLYIDVSQAVKRNGISLTDALLLYIFGELKSQNEELAALRGSLENIHDVLQDVSYATITRRDN